MYTKVLKIKSYDVDCDNNLKLSSITRYFQQVARENLDEIGFTYDFLLEHNIVFVLSKYSIHIYEKIASDDTVILKTSPSEIKGVSFIRDFVVESQDGKKLIEASSTWVIIDFKNRTLLRPAALPASIPHSGKIVEFYPERTNVLEGDFKETRTVRYSDLDSNRHLNNCIYMDIIFDTLYKFLGTVPSCSEITVSYEHEALINDQLEISCLNENGTYHIKCYNITQDNNCFSSIVRA